jgi:hypothetical protein
LPGVEGKIEMAARRQVTNKLRTQYRNASKGDKGKILDRVVDTTGMDRSTARRMLTGPPLPDPAEQLGRRTVHMTSAWRTVDQSWVNIGTDGGRCRGSVAVPGRRSSLTR